MDLEQLKDFTLSISDFSCWTLLKWKKKENYSTLGITEGAKHSFKDMEWAVQTTQKSVVPLILICSSWYLD